MVLELGRTGMSISRVGLGTSAFSGLYWGAQDDLDSVRAIREAVEAGINWIDMAPGRGRAERVVGAAVRAMPDDVRPLLFTKCLRRFDESVPDSPMVVDLSASGIRAQVDASLMRLGVDRIDLLWLHWPDPATPVEESWATVAELVEEGKLRAGGLSNHPVDLLERAEAVHHVEAIQVPLSLLDRSMNGPYGDQPSGRPNGNSGGPDVLPWAVRNQSGVVTFAALQHGLLSGTFSVGRARSLEGEGELLRPALYWFKDPEVSRAIALAESLRPLAEDRRTTIASIAIAWVLAWRGVTGAIVGARRAGQVAGFRDAMAIELTTAELDYIEAQILRTKVGEGTPGMGPSRPVGV